MLDLEAPHRMYYEQSGNPRGVPVVFLHGGPGAGASAVHRQFFDPAFYRIVVYDQRGAGRSHAAGLPREQHHARRSSTTSSGCATHLGIDRWMVFGGSWGSTLALAYAEHHPERCLGARAARHLPLPHERDRLVPLRPARDLPRGVAHLRGLHSRGRARRPAHARTTSASSIRIPRCTCRRRARWSVYEGSCSTLLPNPGAGGRLRLRPRGARPRAHRGALLPRTTSSCRANFLLDNVRAPEGRSPA